MATAMPGDRRAEICFGRRDCPKMEPIDDRCHDYGQRLKSGSDRHWGLPEAASW
ncbi:hypothetical protein OAN47_03825 [Planctomycetota bacterium]|nr:hypothetical protein [Planctomycetota bacterium]